MICQKCHTPNIEEAIRCASCGIALKIITVRSVKPEPSFFIRWLKAFIGNILRPKGLKLWIIIGCTLMFLVPALIGTFFTFIAKPYLLEQHTASSSSKNTASVPHDLNLIEQSRHDLTAIKSEIAGYYAIHHRYPRSLSELKNKPWQNDQISMNGKGYLITDIQGSQPMTMIFVPFLNQHKQLVWDCYLSGFDSSLADTGCIEMSQIQDIPIKGVSIYKN
ncbi:hypothetical protein BEN71_13480 [Acinetobacter wuhouensis]|uniref:hypothetical protein n=1 Tax=Acinetobacter wuhouensis TaxID=1879050 RepID=UPI00083B348C|nr:hypothetical protein [Acinetobacter wuhouensis]AXQ23026.1 hypothetical protein BEN71_13480 [Acinetobacter wuhouensis]